VNPALAWRQEWKMAQTSTDAELIAASLEDGDAFVPIFDRHFAAISRYLRRRLNRETADELAAEVFATAFARRSTYDREYPNALPWLYGIAANLLRAHARYEQRELTVLARTGVDPVVASPNPLASVDGDVGPAVAAALMRLEPRDRETLLLFAWADLSYDEIAHALELPLGTVKSRLNRARRIARGALAERLAAPREEAVNG
jgi:DNA-directed RNA polymerase specialized sigma24 family protein